MENLQVHQHNSIFIEKAPCQRWFLKNSHFLINLKNLENSTLTSFQNADRPGDQSAKVELLQVVVEKIPFLTGAFGGRGQRRQWTL